MEASDGKLGLQSTWSMAVGGMVGGGIFSTLGVVIGIAGRHAWLSFLVAGLVALLAGYSYSRLAIRYGEGGGAFTFLREIHKDGFAGSLAWVLIVGYVLTNAVYAHTFGAYLDHLIPLGPQGARLSALAIVLLFLGVNLRGAGEAGNVEVFLVWFKLAVLFCLAGFGLARWNPAMLGEGVADAGLGQAIFGAAAVFMAYEGFQLLTYDYEDIRDPGQPLLVGRVGQPRLSVHLRRRRRSGLRREGWIESPYGAGRVRRRPGHDRPRPPSGPDVPGRPHGLRRHDGEVWFGVQRP